MRQEQRLRSAVGRRFRVRPDAIGVPRLSVEALQHFALTSGNPNPVYFDAHYARSSARGHLLPPPTWWTEVVDPHVGCQALYTRLATDAVTYDGASPPEPSGQDSGPPLFFLDGLRSFDGGIEFEYLDGPRFDESLRVSGEVTDVTPKRSARLGPFVVMRGNVDYAGNDGTVFVRSSASSLVYGVDGVPRKVDAPEVGLAPTRADDHVLTPVQAMANVTRRGGEARYWEDVVEGDRITCLFKGALDAAEIAVHSVARGRCPQADEQIESAWRMLKCGDVMEAAAFYREIAMNPEFDFGVERHLNAVEARSEGAPGAYDIGTKRAAWAAQAVTDWMGDAAEMVRFSLQIRGFVLVGDRVWCEGTVKRSWLDGARGMVELDVWVENQRQEKVATGTATVCLPRKTS